VASLAWNLINLEGFDNAWESYLNEAEKQLKPKSVSPDNAWVALKLSKEDMIRGTFTTNALCCALELFSDDDWKGMASFLGVWK
jgi:hypothetical protein